MTPYDETKRGQDEWDNDQRRIASSGFWDVTPEDIEAYTKRIKENELEKGKTITVKRNGRPATAEELQAAVEGKPLPPLSKFELWYGTAAVREASPVKVLPAV